MYAKLKKLYTGAMKGRTMYVIPTPWLWWALPLPSTGIELTDSIYVVLNMCIMTRVGTAVAEVIGDDFVKGLHAKADLDPENRYIVHFPEDNTIMSVNSGYGGKCAAGQEVLRPAHRLLSGPQPGLDGRAYAHSGHSESAGEVRYLAAAFPSACGKTNLAMLIPPEHYRKAGWKVWCVGDDIAWIRVGEDGRLWAMNPENGFFGVAPGTNEKSNPNALASTRRGTIFTNVVHNLDNNTVWWEGLDKNPPENAVDWKGNPWNGKTATEKGAHPNSRFTAPAKNCPCISPEFENPKGVPLSAIVFGGRRAKTAPLVYQSLDWNHGVFVGSIMASETTAAAAGAVGVVRRDPMAMLPFCGYNMGDYWQHWLDMGQKVDADKLPKIFNVNWFRTDDEGHFIWPGFGDNLRVLEWIMKRCFNEVDADQTALGYEPRPEDLDLEGSVWTWIPSGSCSAWIGPLAPGRGRHPGVLCQVRRQAAREALGRALRAGEPPEGLIPLPFAFLLLSTVRRAVFLRRAGRFFCAPSPSPRIGWRQRRNSLCPSSICPPPPRRTTAM